MSMEIDKVAPATLAAVSAAFGDRLWVSHEEVGEMLGLGRDRVRDLANVGLLPCVRLGDERRFSREHVAIFLSGASEARKDEAWASRKSGTARTKRTSRSTASGTTSILDAEINDQPARS